MAIKQQGGVFGRNPTFNDVNIDKLTVDGSASVNGPLDCDGFTSNGQSNFVGTLGTVFVDSQGAFLNFTRNSGNYIRTTGASSSLYINTASTNRIGIFNTGDINLYKDDGTTVGATWDASAGNLAFASGNGIDFSATSGTGTSELFDDYEEGTWTPVISDANSGGNLGSAVITDATYTKIGRTVVLGASLTNIDTTGMTSTNVLWIQGLPFTSAAATYAVGNVKVDTVTFPASRTYIYCQVGGGVTYMNFQVAGSGIAEDNLDAQHISSGVSDIQFSITYTAT